MLCRSDQAWKTAFREAGLTLIKQQTQLGLPNGLYTVNMYADTNFSRRVHLLSTNLGIVPRYALR